MNNGNDNNNNIKYSISVIFKLVTSKYILKKIII